MHSVDGTAGSSHLQQIRLTHLRDLDVDVGRFVRCWSILRPPPGPLLPQDYAFDRHAYFTGLDAVGYVQGRCRAGSAGPLTGGADIVAYRLATSRRHLAHYVSERAGPRAGGFAAALISGDRSLMSESDREALRQSGLAHLMAISGLHMGLVCGLVYLLVWRVLSLIEPVALRVSVRKPGACAALISGFAYLVMSGGSVSTQRAYVMALVFFTAVLFDRRAFSLQSLALAMCLIVLWQPWTVLTPGFQMSFAATGALIATYDAWRDRRTDEALPLKGASFWLKSLLVTAIVSTLATAPFALYHFDRVASLGVFANLFAMPVVSLVSAPVALLAAISAPFGLADIPLALFGRSLELILAIAHVFSTSEHGTVAGSKTMPAFALACFALTVAVPCIAQKPLWGLAASTSVVGLAVWALSSPLILHWSPKGDVFYRADSGRVHRVEVTQGDGLVPIGWRDAATDGNCLPNGCVLRTDAGPILILGTHAPHRCEQVADMLLVLVTGDVALPEECARKQVRWADLDPQRGYSWHQRFGRLTPVRHGRCGARAWQTCAQNAVLIRSAE